MQMHCLAPAFPSPLLARRVKARMAELVLVSRSAGEVYQMLKHEFPDARPELIHQCADALLSKEGW